MDTRLLTFRNLIKFFKNGDTKSLVGEHNDLFCLFLSQMVYFSHAFIIKHLKELGTEIVTIIDYDGPTAVCVKFNGVNYLCVKGLSGRNREEWPIILNFIPKDFEGAKVHRGFAITTQKLVPHVRDFLNDGDPVILTGHSMGGAIVTLTSLLVGGCKVVTFGAPKTVDADMLEVFSSKDITHYRINTDFVTLLPPFVYNRPGNHVTQRKAWLWQFWVNHKLYTYSSFMMPAIIGGQLAYQLSSD